MNSKEYSVEKDRKITPLMKQYLNIKKKHPDKIVLFRLGDFYEMFYDDAIEASKILGIVLTTRDKDKIDPVPMCGIPHHALDRYIQTLIEAGRKVVICEQMEDPKTAKGLVKRDIVEIITPGTAVEQKAIQKGNIYLSAINPKKEIWGVAYIDISTGEFNLTEGSKNDIIDEVTRIKPVEIIIPEETKEIYQWHNLLGYDITITPYPSYEFNLSKAEDLLKEHFQVNTLSGFGCDDYPSGVTCAGVILSYLHNNQQINLSHINYIHAYSLSKNVILDKSTIKNLELFPEKYRESSLFNVLDRTKTPMGARMLKNFILYPLKDKHEIQSRQQAIEELINNTIKMQEITKEISRMGDLERFGGKLGRERSNPKDLLALSNSLKRLPAIRDILLNFNSELLCNIRQDLFEPDEVVKLIDESIDPDAPLNISDGGVIKKGYSPELDELRNALIYGKEWIASLQQKERHRTNIPSLKVGYNKIFGYYIEITKPNLDKVPVDYIRKQTLTNAERFITPELKEWESKVLGAEEKIIKLESELFSFIRNALKQYIPAIMKSARAIALLDSLLSLAYVALSENYVKPEFNDENFIKIEEGRHPIIEVIQKDRRFVPNSIFLDNENQQIIILTGPNMGGKSTYLRQTGLITLMAHIGSYVPAKSASISIIDRIFTRVGASDDITKGLSTFLMEMVETANILHHSTSNSLVLLDEIGRGTSTYDGLSIAWAVVEYLHNNKNRPKTIFATHYHELTQTALELNRVKNFNVAVEESNNQVSFLYRVVEGAANKSYGIHVAQMAGIPKEVISRAWEILKNIEDQQWSPDFLPKLAKRRSLKQDDYEQLSLFSVLQHPVVSEISKIELEKISPIEALNILYKLKEKVLKEKND